MNIESMSKQKRVIIVSLLLLPIIICTSLIFYLRYSWRTQLPSGEVLSPIENRPLFVGLIVFVIGYLFFLGMLFSDNLLQLFNKRRNLMGR